MTMKRVSLDESLMRQCRNLLTENGADEVAAVGICDDSLGDYLINIGLDPDPNWWIHAPRLKSVVLIERPQKGAEPDNLLELFKSWEMSEEEISREQRHAENECECEFQLCEIPVCGYLFENEAGVREQRLKQLLALIEITYGHDSRPNPDVPNWRPLEQRLAELSDDEILSRIKSLQKKANEPKKEPTAAELSSIEACEFFSTPEIEEELRQTREIALGPIAQKEKATHE